MKSTTPGALLEAVSATAHQRFGNDARWAAAAKLPKETLSRARRRASCDFRTLVALIELAGYQLAAVRAPEWPRSVTREYEDDLRALGVSRNTDPKAWRALGNGFFMGGLAVALASTRHLDRRRYLQLAEELHPGVSTPEVFGMWLERTPLRVPRFLGMLEQELGK